MTNEKNVQPIRDAEKIQEMKDCLLKFCSYRDYVLFTFGINIGLRVSDILQLRVKDVRNQERLNVTEKKTKKYKSLRLMDGVQKLLNDYTKDMADDEWLFPSRKGDKPISTTQAYRVLNKAAEYAGINDVGTHTMRKTFGYWHYKRHKDVAILQKLFNHSAPSITLIYIGIEQDEIDNTMDFML